MDKEVGIATPRNCPLCGVSAEKYEFQKGTLEVVRCGECGMVYANPVDCDLVSGRFYDRLGESFYLSPEKLVGDYHPVRFQRELGWFRRYCRGGWVLDVGCSTGAFLFHLRMGTGLPRRGMMPVYRVVGMDVSGPALDHAEFRGIPVIRGDFLAHEFEGRRFDAVTFWAVLEHVGDPLGFVRRAEELLVPGGHCFVLVPNLDSLAVRLLGPQYRYFMPDHINYFDPRTLVELVHRVPGMELVAMGSTHFNPLVIWQDWRGGTDRVADEARTRLLSRTNAWKTRRWLAPARWIYRGMERLLGTFGLADNLILVMRRSGGRR